MLIKAKLDEDFNLAMTEQSCSRPIFPFKKKAILKG